MVYILMVNANMFADPFGDGSNPLGVSYGAIYIATAISSIVGTVLAGLIANLPLAQASGMGLNAFFVYTVCVGFGLSYANALVLILAEGLVFILLTITALRKKIFDALPVAVRVAIVIMSHKNVRGAVLIGILGGMGLYYLLGLSVEGFYDALNITFVSPFQEFREFTSQSLFQVFKSGFDFTAYTAQHGNTNLILTVLTTALAFCMVDMFDTLGTLYAACERAGLMDKYGDPINMNAGMLSDAIATTFGALCGTSTVTTFSEVNAGVAAGGRTGLTSLFCGLFFFVAMFLSPIAQLIPSCTTAAALIYVGFLMIGSVKNIHWDDLKISIPAFLTLIIMPFTYNISYGIDFDLISYIVISIFCGDFKKIKGSSWVIAGLFIAMLLLTH